MKYIPILCTLMENTKRLKHRKMAGELTLTDVCRTEGFNASGPESVQKSARWLGLITRHETNLVKPRVP
jgi:hypothetical protein